MALKSRLVALALAAGLCVAGWSVPAAAFLIKYKLLWEGDNGYSMAGGFKFDDSVLAGGPLIQKDELTAFSASFYDPADVLLKTYDLTNQASFWNFNFEYDTRVLRQTGAPTSSDGLIIGDEGGNEWLLFADSGCTSGVVDIQLLSTSQTCVNVVDGSQRFFVEAIPEPAMVGLFAAGLAGIGLFRRQRAR